MDTNIYLAAYKDFNDYELLKVVCDKITSTCDKENTTFFVTTGETGDNTCMRYAVENGFKIEDWFPDEKFAGIKRECMANGNWKHFYYQVLKPEKNRFISKSDHVIFVYDYDLKNNGIGCGINMAAKNSKTISVVYPDKKEVYVYRPSAPKTAYVYSLEGGEMTHVRTERR
jgi:hypothetical protein